MPKKLTSTYGKLAIETGERLKLARLALGIKSQREMSDLLGVGRVRYHFWEVGKSLPDTETMASFKNKFGVSMDYIYTGDMSALPLSIAQKLHKE